MGHATCDGPAGIGVEGIDLPRTTINIATLVAVTACVASCMLRLSVGQSPSILSAYASITAIEIAWFAGQAIIMTHRDWNV